MKRRKFIGTLSAATIAGVTGYQTISCRSKPGGQQSGEKTMPRRLLGPTGAEVSVLALGGVIAMAEEPTAEQNPAELANAALDLGINYFDTAASYGGGQSERNFGVVVAKRRDEIFLATKTRERSYDGVMREFGQSLERLQTDHVDLLQVHMVLNDEDITGWEKPDGVLTAFYKLRDEKVIRFIGVTGHDSAETMCRAIETYDFDTVLTTFNPVARRLPFEHQVIPLAQERNMGIVAMKLMGGGYGSLAIGNPIKNNEARWYYDQASRQTDASTLIRFALGLPISSATIGIASLGQLQQNVAAARDMEPLNEAERKDLMEYMV